MKHPERLIAVVMLLILGLAVVPIAAFSRMQSTVTSDFVVVTTNGEEPGTPEAAEPEEMTVVAAVEPSQDSPLPVQISAEAETQALPQPAKSVSVSMPVKKKNVNKMEIDPELQLSIDEETMLQYASFLHRELGFNTAAIAGVLANFQMESGFDIHKVGDMGFAYGLCQWRGARLERLTQFCKENHLNPVSLEGQLAYFKLEMKEYYVYAYDLIRLVDNTEAGVEQATLQYCTHFEAPADVNGVMPARLKLAKQLIYPTLVDLGWPGSY